MAIDKKAYALANGYTDETVIGGGAIKGKNCTISKIEDINGGHRITFGWTLDNGTTKSQTLDVKDGADGHTPVKGIDYYDGEKGDKGEQGANGVDGTTYTPSIGTVTTVESNVEASATVSVNNETKEAVFNFAIPKGKDGDRNADTVNNHTVKSDVPENAVFTDTIYDDTEVKAEIAKNGTPVGCIFPFAGINLPVGYLLCNGASYKVADYPDLYAVIGNTYGGDSTNFNVPDYRETVLVGVGENTTDTIASHDVYELGEFKDDQLQRITGDFESGNRNTQPRTNGAFSTKESQYTWFALSETATTSSRVEFDSSTVTRSGTTTHGKQKGVTYIIKAR